MAKSYPGIQKLGFIAAGSTPTAAYSLPTQIASGSGVNRYALVLIRHTNPGGHPGTCLVGGSSLTALGSEGNNTGRNSRVFFGALGSGDTGNLTVSGIINTDSEIGGIVVGSGVVIQAGGALTLSALSDFSYNAAGSGTYSPSLAIASSSAADTVYFFNADIETGATGMDANNGGTLVSGCNLPLELAVAYKDWTAGASTTVGVTTTGARDLVMFGFALTEAASADTTPPVITGPSGATGSTSSKSQAENTATVHTFTADESVTWDLNGGADVALFTINSSTGALSFLSAPNFEAPADADTNNTYVVGVRATDAATNATTQTLTVTITDADETSPSLSSPTATSAAPLTCQGTVSTNEATGALYAVATASATAPSAAQVKLGQDHTGAAALRVVSQAVSGSGAQTVASGAVTAGTRYLHYMHEDAAGNQSTVVSSSSFVVAASYSITTDALEDENGAVLASTALTRAYAIRLSDHALVASWAAPTTNGSGQLVLADAALTTAPHLIATVSNANADAGAKVYTPA